MSRKGMGTSGARRSDSARVRELRASLARQERQLTTLANVAMRVHAEEDEERILQIALDEILKQLGLETAWIFLAEGGEDRLRLAAARGVSPRYLKETEQDGLAPCLCPSVFSTGERTQARNTVQCPRMPHLIEGLDAPVAHACIPLRLEASRRGVLNVAARPGEQFTEDELQFLETVGHQLCLALERAKHHRAERARIQEARALAAISKALGGSLEIGAVLQAVGDTARELLRADRVHIFLGSESSRLSVAHLSGMPHPELSEGDTLDLVAVEAHIQRRAFEERRTFRVDDWRKDARVNKSLSRRWRVGSAIVSPLVSRDQPLGLLVVTRSQPHAWSTGEIDMAEALAGQASVALENARLYGETKRAYQELKDAQARIIQSEKLAAVGTFASGLAHEVRNPLNSVALQLSLLERRTAPLEPRLATEVRDLIGIIREEIKRLDGLVGDFLELSRAGRVQYRLTDLETLIDEIVRLLRPEARAAEITLRRQQLGEPAPPLLLDGEKMKQVVINLVRNAIEAMPDGGVVTVESGVTDGIVRMRVRDTGPGLPENLDVFQLFVTTKARGTGLGLSIAQQIVLEHGGVLTAESEPGKGATFTVTLPLRPGADRAEEKRA
jgi:two-component system, NtrC family, sensor histidine kinase HydH